MKLSEWLEADYQTSVNVKKISEFTGLSPVKIRKILVENGFKTSATAGNKYFWNTCQTEQIKKLDQLFTSL